MNKINSTLLLVLLFTLFACANQKKDDSVSNRAKKIGSLIFKTKSPDPFESQREKKSLIVTYQLMVRNLAKIPKKLDLSFSELFINNEKKDVQCFDFERKKIVQVTNKSITTIFCVFKLAKVQPKAKEAPKKDQVRVLISIDGLESLRFDYQTRLESDFL